MEKEFIPYDLTLELKKLGFDEECLAHYIGDDNFSIGSFQNANILAKLNKKELSKAPLWQQAFDWFLNRGYFADIKPDLIITSFWSYRVVDINAKYNPENLHCYRFTYYRDARLECLKKLIEIAKEQNVK